MRGFLFLWLVAAPFALGPEIGPDDAPQVRELDSVTVVAHPAGKSTPVAHSNVTGTALREGTPLQSLPDALSMQTSVVSTDEGGMGCGYSGLRIRGVGGYHTNVTLNGITLNDAESQEVFWVNIPGIQSFLSSVQIQRGLGTSSSGTGAFGAGLSMSTQPPSDAFSAGASLSAGAFGTLCASLNAATGKSAHGFFAQGTFSTQRYDGYMKGAGGALQSACVSAGWTGAADRLSLVWMNGSQHTGITWEGCPFDVYPTDRRYNPAEGATDNYVQNHFQLNHRHSFSDISELSTTLNFTAGGGYYDYPSTVYGMHTVDGLANRLWVLRSEFVRRAQRLSLSSGIYLSHYGGSHYGDWDEQRAYDNVSVKREADLWARGEFKASDIVTLFADLQFRLVGHDMTGPDEYGQTLDWQGRWIFFNPRAGVNIASGRRGRFFLSAATARREPSRSDIQASQDVRPETLLDFEAGYCFSGDKFGLEAGLYDMEYFDALLETGELNSAGYAIKRNCGRGARRGVELSASWKPLRVLALEGAATLSSNLVNGSEMLLSPPVVSSLRLRLTPLSSGDGPLHRAELLLDAKYVSRQHWDNSGSADTLIPEYFVADLALNLPLHLRRGVLTAGLYVRNLLNREYYSYAWSGGVYPQAPANASFKISFEF